MAVLIWLVGMATWYNPAQYEYGVTFCGDDISTAPWEWAAVDVRYFEAGQVLCGDLLEIRFSDRVLYLPARDAGPFEGYYIADHPELPILVDLPRPVWPKETRSEIVTVTNLSERTRRYEKVRSKTIWGGLRQLPAFW